MTARADTGLTKKAIAEYQQKQTAAFIQSLNQWLETQEFTLAAEPFIYGEGRIRARIIVVTK